MNKTTASRTLPINANEVVALLEQGQHPYWRQMNIDLVRQLVRDYQNWPAPLVSDSETKRSALGRSAQRLCNFLLYDTDQTMDQLTTLKTKFADYSSRYVKAISEDERNRHILAYARELGATRNQLRKDEKAFKRWFGHDAVSERYQHKYLETERYLSFKLQLLGRMSALVLSVDGKTLGYQVLWQRLALEPVLKPLLDYSGDKRVVASAFNALTVALRALPVALQHESVSEASLRFIYHACLKSKLSVWVQCEALQLLQSASPESLAVVLRKRLEHPQADDDLFVRRKVVQLIAEQTAFDPELAKLYELAVNDQSPSVRQKLAEVLATADQTDLTRHFPALLFDDAIAPVRAAALLSLLKLLSREDCFQLALTYLQQSLLQEQDNFPLRTALMVCRNGLDQILASANGQQKDQYLSTLLPAIEQLHQEAASIAVRRWAAQTREYLLCHADSAKLAQIQALTRFVTTIPPGKTRRIPKQLVADTNDEQLGRLLSVIAQNDFGFDVENSFIGRFITRGHAFGFRIWRLIHEFRHASPDKRQAFSHTVGRLFWGEMRIPSAILSELAETKVPGEPFFIDTEEGWRGYLPLVDEVLSSLKLGNKTSYFFHSEGITQLQPPGNPFERWLASWKISLYFADFARLRNWQEKSQHSPQSYLHALTNLGIKVTFNSHASTCHETSADPAVLRFFPAFLPFQATGLWEQFKDYFVSIYENTLYDLALFITLVASYFMGRNIYLYRKIKKARNNLPLVLGGWGTRGKSGTERIKAGLINALGHSLVSKTTGCEAMFLYAHPFGQLREMFLFRPYDKATIWEQHNLVCMADKLKSNVFLWECMGLTPAYVDILQRQWMRDDISTITNTYPDHEDIQGPAGINIPQVMTNFIPYKGTLLTSEEQMRPILQAAATQRNTRLRSVGWLEAGLLAPDVLKRFPYDEHPFNIALVLALADELGVDQDFALKEMADRVVPDIGVLKTFPAAPWQSRRLQFINGMSANERYGCLSNWVRMSFDKLTPEQNPDTWITIVVNNRADRISRSRVFASIVVKDIQFDRCVLIGNNLAGFNSYIKESWDEWIATVTLESNEDSAEEILLDMAKRFRIPFSEDSVFSRFSIMLEAQGHALEPDFDKTLLSQPDQLEKFLLANKITHHQDIAHYVQDDMNLLASYHDFLHHLEKEKHKGAGSLDSRFHHLLWQWFEKKLVVIENYHATGNQVIETIGKASPPGFLNKIMGIQNIKGTGLDFVYCWQAWESCYKACQQLISLSKTESNLGLRTLAAFQEHNILTEETVRMTVARVLDSVMSQNEFYHAELDVIIATLEKSLEKLDTGKNHNFKINSWVASFSKGIESFLDSGDAVKRRKKADQIYKDLIDKRIAFERAAMELRMLNKRQKGGWLHLTDDV